MKKLILSAMLLVALTFGMTSCNNTEKKTMTEQGKHNHIDGDNHETVYKCPMDCEKGKTYEKKELALFVKWNWSKKNIPTTKKVMDMITKKVMDTSIKILSNEIQLIYAYIFKIILSTRTY